MMMFYAPQPQDLPLRQQERPEPWALESAGVSIKDQNGQLKDMDPILDEMGEK